MRATSICLGATSAIKFAYSSEILRTSWYTDWRKRREWEQQQKKKKVNAKQWHCEPNERIDEARQLILLAIFIHFNFSGLSQISHHEPMFWMRDLTRERKKSGLSFFCIICWIHFGFRWFSSCTLENEYNPLCFQVVEMPMKHLNRKLKQEQWLRLCSSQRQTGICSHRMYAIVIHYLTLCWASWFFLLPIPFTSLLFSSRSNAHFGANFKITCIVTYEKDEVNILVSRGKKRTNRKMRALEVMPHILAYTCCEVNEPNLSWAASSVEYIDGKQQQHQQQHWNAMSFTLKR